MSTELAIPKTLREAIIHYSDTKVCHDLMVSIRFPNGMCCVHCGDTKNVKFMESVQRFKCYSCRKQFSLKTGTVLEDSPIPFTKWLPAFWLLTSGKNGISSYELHRALGVTQKTAWFMLHRIRHILATGTFEKLAGTVEADETFVGGKEKNKHSNKKLRQGRGAVGKTIVAGVLERSTDPRGTSRVMADIIPNTKKKTLQALVTDRVETGSIIYTDSLQSYSDLSQEFIHDFVDHAIQYAKGAVHTNGMENFWSLLKRGLKGTYISVKGWHLEKYIDEQAFRFNTRKDTDADRFLAALRLATGRRLTYEELIGAHAEDIVQAI